MTHAGDPGMGRPGAWTLELRSGPRKYEVSVEAFCFQRLNRGLLEYSFEDSQSLADYTTDQFNQLWLELPKLWPTAKQWDLLTPLPDYRTAAAQRPEVVDGRICAAVLYCQSEDFPGVGGAEGADYSLANVIWIVEAGEGLFPARVFDAVDWERVARPALL